MGNSNAKVSLLGLGRMGEPMARNILSKLGSLTVWNRSSAATARMESLGANVAITPREAAAEITLTVLPDLSDVEALLDGPDGLLAGWQDAGFHCPILVVHGTVSPVKVATLAAKLLAEHGVWLVDAPMSGGTIGAENGTLSIMLGGHAEVVSDLDSVMNAVGTTVRYFGPVGSGELAKACNQIVVAGTIAAISEAMFLAQESGLDKSVLLEILRGGLANSEILRQKGDNWANYSFVAGGSAKNQLKDLRFVREAEVKIGVDLPTTNTVADLFERMIEAGLGELDHTGLFAFLSSQHENAK